MEIRDLGKVDKMKIVAAGAILEAIAEFPDGAPAGPIYVAVQQYFDFDQFTRILADFIQQGLIRRDGFHLLYPTEKLINLLKSGERHANN